LPVSARLSANLAVAYLRHAQSGLIFHENFLARDLLISSEGCACVREGNHHGD
jgi:hypothetical protein